MRAKSESNIKFLLREETEILFEKIDRDTSIYRTRNRAIFYVAKYCALRASEVGLINIHDYNPVNGSLFCRRLKGSRNNTLMIIDDTVKQNLNAHYYEMCETYIDGPLFRSQKGNPINRKTLDFLMKSYCENTIIPCDKRHFHTLKHTRAMELIEYPGIKLTDIQWWLGHKNIANTMKYLDYTSAAMKELFDYLSLVEGKGEKICQQNILE